MANCNQFKSKIEKIKELIKGNIIETILSDDYSKYINILDEKFLITEFEEDSTEKELKDYLLEEINSITTDATKLVTSDVNNLENFFKEISLNIETDNKNDVYTKFISNLLADNPELIDFITMSFNNDFAKTLNNFYDTYKGLKNIEQQVNTGSIKTNMQKLLQMGEFTPITLSEARIILGDNFDQLIEKVQIDEDSGEGILQFKEKDLKKIILEKSGLILSSDQLVDSYTKAGLDLQAYNSHIERAKKLLYNFLFNIRKQVDGKDVAKSIEQATNDFSTFFGEDIPVNLNIGLVIHNINLALNNEIKNSPQNSERQKDLVLFKNNFLSLLANNSDLGKILPEFEVKVIKGDETKNEEDLLYIDFKKEIQESKTGSVEYIKYKMLSNSQHTAAHIVHNSETIDASELGEVEQVHISNIPVLIFDSKQFADNKPTIIKKIKEAYEKGENLNIMSLLLPSENPNVPIVFGQKDNAGVPQTFNKNIMKNLVEKLLNGEKEITMKDFVLNQLIENGIGNQDSDIANHAFSLYLALFHKGSYPYKYGNTYYVGTSLNNISKNMDSIIESLDIAQEDKNSLSTNNALRLIYEEPDENISKLNLVKDSLSRVFSYIQTLNTINRATINEKAEIGIMRGGFYKTESEDIKNNIISILENQKTYGFTVSGIDANENKRVTLNIQPSEELNTLTQSTVTLNTIKFSNRYFPIESISLSNGVVEVKKRAVSVTGVDRNNKPITSTIKGSSIQLNSDNLDYILQDIMKYIPNGKSVINHIYDNTQVDKNKSVFNLVSKIARLINDVNSRTDEEQDLSVDSIKILEELVKVIENTQIISIDKSVKVLNENDDLISSTQNHNPLSRFSTIVKRIQQNFSHPAKKNPFISGKIKVITNLVKGGLKTTDDSDKNKAFKMFNNIEAFAQNFEGFFLNRLTYTKFRSAIFQPGVFSDKTQPGLVEIIINNNKGNNLFEELFLGNKNNPINYFEQLSFSAKNNLIESQIDYHKGLLEGMISRYINFIENYNETFGTTNSQEFTNTIKNVKKYIGSTETKTLSGLKLSMDNILEAIKQDNKDRKNKIYIDKMDSNSEVGFINKSGKTVTLWNKQDVGGLDTKTGEIKLTDLFNNTVAGLILDEDNFIEKGVYDFNNEMSFSNYLDWSYKNMLEDLKKSDYGITSNLFRKILRTFNTDTRGFRITYKKYIAKKQGVIYKPNENEEDVEHYPVKDLLELENNMLESFFYLENFVFANHSQVMMGSPYVYKSKIRKGGHRSGIDFSTTSTDITKRNVAQTSSGLAAEIHGDEPSKKLNKYSKVAIVNDPKTVYHLLRTSEENEQKDMDGAAFLSELEILMMNDSYGNTLNPVKIVGTAKNISPVFDESGNTAFAKLASYAVFTPSLMRNATDEHRRFWIKMYSSIDFDTTEQIIVTNDKPYKVKSRNMLELYFNFITKRENENTEFKKDLDELFSKPISTSNYLDFISKHSKTIYNVGHNYWEDILNFLASKSGDKFRNQFIGRIHFPTSEKAGLHHVNNIDKAKFGDERFMHYDKDNTFDVIQLTKNHNFDTTGEINLEHESEISLFSQILRMVPFSGQNLFDANELYSALNRLGGIRKEAIIETIDKTKSKIIKDYVLNDGSILKLDLAGIFGEQLSELEQISNDIKETIKDKGEITDTEKQLIINEQIKSLQKSQELDNRLTDLANKFFMDSLIRNALISRNDESINMMINDTYNEKFNMSYDLREVLPVSISNINASVTKEIIRLTFPGAMLVVTPNQNIIRLFTIKDNQNKEHRIYRSDYENMINSQFVETIDKHSDSTFKVQKINTEERGSKFITEQLRKFSKEIDILEENFEKGDIIYLEFMTNNYIKAYTIKIEKDSDEISLDSELFNIVNNINIDEFKGATNKSFTVRKLNKYKEENLKYQDYEHKENKSKLIGESKNEKNKPNVDNLFGYVIDLEQQIKALNKKKDKTNEDKSLLETLNMKLLEAKQKVDVALRNKIKLSENYYEYTDLDIIRILKQKGYISSTGSIRLDSNDSVISQILKDYTVDKLKTLINDLQTFSETFKQSELYNQLYIEDIVGDDINIAIRGINKFAQELGLIHNDYIGTPAEAIMPMLHMNAFRLKDGMTINYLMSDFAIDDHWLPTFIKNILGTINPRYENARVTSNKADEKEIQKRKGMWIKYFKDNEPMKEKINKIQTVKDIRNFEFNELRPFAEELQKQFDKSLEFVGIRIPSQSKGHGTYGKITEFENTMGNISMVSSAAMVIKGEDLDIDMNTVVVRAVHTDGFKRGYIANYESLLTNGKLDSNKRIWKEKFDKEGNVTRIPDNDAMIEALKNYIFDKLVEVLKNPANAYEIQSATSFGEIGEFANKVNLPLSNDYFNTFQRTLMERVTMVGKDGIGIFASGTKALSGIYMSYAKFMYDKQYHEYTKLNYEFTPIIKEKGQAGALLGDVYKLSDEPMIFEEIPNLNQLSDYKITKIFKDIKDLEEYLENNPDEEIAERLKDIKDFISNSDSRDLANEKISQFLSAATDNAKELILGRINANMQTSNMIAALTSLNIPLGQILDFINAPVVKSVFDKIEKTNTSNFAKSELNNYFTFNLSSYLLNIISKVEKNKIDNLKSIVRKELNVSSTVPIRKNHYLQYISRLSNMKVTDLNEQLNSLVGTISFLTPETGSQDDILQAEKNRQELEILLKLNKVNEAGKEYAIIAKILAINQSLPNSDFDNYSYQQKIENFINGKYTEKLTTVFEKFNLKEYINSLLGDKEYANRQIEQYQQTKEIYNIPLVVAGNEDFIRYLDGFNLSNSLIQSNLITVPATNRVLEMIYTDKAEFSEDIDKGDEKQHKRAKDLVQGLLIGAYFERDNHKLLFDERSNKTSFKRKLQIGNKMFEYDLSTAKGRMDYIKNFPNFILNLQQAINGSEEYMKQFLGENYEQGAKYGFKDFINAFSLTKRKSKKKDDNEQPIKFKDIMRLREDQLKMFMKSFDSMSKEMKENFFFYNLLTFQLSKKKGSFAQLIDYRFKKDYNDYLNNILYKLKEKNTNLVDYLGLSLSDILLLKPDFAESEKKDFKAKKNYEGEYVTTKYIRAHDGSLFSKHGYALDKVYQSDSEDVYYINVNSGVLDTKTDFKPFSINPIQNIPFSISEILKLKDDGISTANVEIYGYKKPLSGESEISTVNDKFISLNDLNSEKLLEKNNKIKLVDC